MCSVGANNFDKNYQHANKTAEIVVHCWIITVTVGGNRPHRW